LKTLEKELKIPSPGSQDCIMKELFSLLEESLIVRRDSLEDVTF
jgi:hypothetical protein